MFQGSETCFGINVDQKIIMEGYIGQYPSNVIMLNRVYFQTKYHTL